MNNNWTSRFRRPPPRGQPNVLCEWPLIASEQLALNIANQITHLDFDISAFKKIRNDLSTKRFDDYKNLLEILREKISKDWLRANDLARKKGASGWLGCLPLKREDFVARAICRADTNILTWWTFDFRNFWHRSRPKVAFSLRWFFLLDNYLVSHYLLCNLYSFISRSYSSGASRMRTGQGICVPRQGILGHFRLF